MAERETYYKCTVCGRVGSVGRCCGTDTRHPLNDAARAESIGNLDLVARIRQAIGDDGKRMQDDLIEHCRQIAAAADLLARVRAAVQVSEVKPYAEWHSLTIDGPEQPLRELAEALTREKR